MSVYKIRKPLLVLFLAYWRSGRPELQCKQFDLPRIHLIRKLNNAEIFRKRRYQQYLLRPVVRTYWFEPRQLVRLEELDQSCFVRIWSRSQVPRRQKYHCSQVKCCRRVYTKANDLDQSTCHCSRFPRISSLGCDSNRDSPVL